MRALLALVAGSLFGAGLTLSGMVDPQRVRGFLDLFGRWDPTLAFVMAGGLIPMGLAWILQRNLSKPFADAQFDLPGTSRLDTRLAAGAVIFGIGWGLAGLCPGPAVAGLALQPQAAAVFVAAMIAGMLLERMFSPPRPNLSTAAKP